MPKKLTREYIIKTELKKDTRRFPKEKFKSIGEFIRQLGGYAKYYQWLKDNPIRSNKIGRNEPCPCGSNKKYKKCCLNKKKDII